MRSPLKKVRDTDQSPIIEGILDYVKGFPFSLHRGKPQESLQFRNGMSRFIFKIKPLCYGQDWI